MKAYLIDIFYYEHGVCFVDGPSFGCFSLMAVPSS